jgi:hypothetical protein
MQITKKISLAQYCRESRYRNRCDAGKAPRGKDWRKVLISENFYYFGRNAVPIPARFSEIQVGRGFKNKFSDAFIEAFVGWLKKHRRGRKGLPCVWDHNAEAARARNACCPQHPKEQHCRC